VKSKHKTTNNSNKIHVTHTKWNVISVLTIQTVKTVWGLLWWTLTILLSLWSLSAFNSQRTDPEQHLMVVRWVEIIQQLLSNATSQADVTLKQTEKMAHDSSQATVPVSLICY